jgi:hypothetical protein
MAPSSTHAVRYTLRQTGQKLAVDDGSSQAPGPVCLRREVGHGPESKCQSNRRDRVLAPKLGFQVAG